VSIMQDAGIVAGTRSVRGSVTAASQAAAVGWALQQGALLTGDDDGSYYPQPEEIETEFEFVPLTNAMVVHLKFDGNYNDSSGHGNAGAAVGTPTLIAGKIGSGALHYSTDTASSSYNYVTLNDPTDLQFGPGQDFSMAFWTRFTGLPGSLPFLANNYNSYGDIDVTLAPSALQGGWSWYMNDAFAAPGQGIGASDPVGATLNNGQWHNLVYTFARSNFTTVYLDGAMVGQTSIAAASGWNFEAGYPWNIGQASGSYAADGQFDMDDLGIWRRALSQAEAESVYIVGQAYGLSFDSYGAVKITANLTHNGLELIWQAGTLLSSDNANGPWAQVVGATAPYYKAPIGPGKKFYRVQL